VVNALTATVRVSTSDRPGLLQDMADAINQVGLSVSVRTS
jgi:UTP:GlnB (protein PII) uridylyltransferase